MIDYYILLGVGERYCSDKAKIRSKYLDLLKFFHPDNNNVPPDMAREKTQQIIAAYKTLTNENEKRVYDEKLRQYYQTQEKQANSRTSQHSERKSQQTYSSTTNTDKERTTRRAARQGDFSYEVLREVGVISESRGGWKKEINYMAWNGRDPKYDIRDWSPNHEKMGKGVTLTRDEGKALYELLKKIFE